MRGIAIISGSPAVNFSTHTGLEKNASMLISSSVATESGFAYLDEHRLRKRSSATVDLADHELIDMCSSA